jgi:hypothetical protein
MQAGRWAQADKQAGTTRQAPVARKQACRQAGSKTQASRQAGARRQEQEGRCTLTGRQTGR